MGVSLGGTRPVACWGRQAWRLDNQEDIKLPDQSVGYDNQEDNLEQQIED